MENNEETSIPHSEILKAIELCDCPEGNHDTVREDPKFHTFGCSYRMWYAKRKAQINLQKGKE